jgi:hypothetical protein
MFEQRNILWLSLAVAAGCNVVDRPAEVGSRATPIEDDGTIERDEWREYGPFEVASNETLRATLTMDGGDADLYLRVGRAPSLSRADCRPYLSGSQTEQCEVTGPASVYVAVSGYAWRTDFELAVTLTEESAPVCGNASLDEGEVCDGKSIECSALAPSWSGTAACLEDCSGWNEADCIPGEAQQLSEADTLSAGMWRHYGPFNTLPGELRAVLEGPGTGDADLYVRRSVPPNTTDHDCRSTGPDSIESCTVVGPGMFYVSVRGYAATSDYTLKVDYIANHTTPQPRVNHAAGTVSASQWTYVGPYFHGAGRAQIILSGTGDADLFVRAGSQPGPSSYDCRPYRSDSNEVCDLDLESTGELWIGVNAYGAAAYFELVSVYIAD